MIKHGKVRKQTLLQILKMLHGFNVRTVKRRRQLNIQIRLGSLKETKKIGLLKVV